ncbi:MAG: hypothetical protein CVU57_15275 [Deltaproteobacteria bacterium HGW-Deltaproteobacteria-15]|jgi:outer membrane immunogenic protein|nr:MAG: hypothetical protein CVU57_15275 [Deltaproteobacteria bacterium HGW-Deltaproteobacteria-15]
MTRIVRIVGVLAAVWLMGEMAHAAPGDVGSSSNWSGPYIGAFAGYSWVDLDYSEPDFPGSERNPTINGVTGGAFLGYNHRFERILLGIEADVGLGDLDEGRDETAWNNYSAFDIDWNAHFRARLGFVSGSTLIYIAGGLAFAKVTVDDTDPGWGEDDATHVGWTAGAGVEHAFTRNLRARIEYLYDDYGKEDYSIDGFFTYRSDVDLTANTVRVGLSYQF